MTEQNLLKVRVNSITCLGVENRIDISDNTSKRSVFAEMSVETNNISIRQSAFFLLFLRLQ